VALLHADAEHGFRPLTLPLVQVRAAAEAARAARLLSRRAAEALVAAAASIHYTERTWPAVLAALPGGRRGRSEALAALLPSVPDVKAEDARACLGAALAFARARRAGAPAPVASAGPATASAHLRRLRLARAPAIVPGARAEGGGRVPGEEVMARLRRRPDAGRLAADGLRRLLLAAWARGLGLTAAEASSAAAERAWLVRLAGGSRPVARREAMLAALALDEGAARRLAEDLALEAELLTLAERIVPDGPSWDEGLALGARLSGAWLEALTPEAIPRTTRRRRSRR